MVKAYKKSPKKNIKRKIFQPLFTAGIVFVIAILIYSLLKLKNGSSSVIKLYFEPEEIVLSSFGKTRDEIQEIKIKAKARNNRIAFARVTFVFDPGKINLYNGINTNINLSKVIEKTSLREANTRGRAVVVIAAAPENNPPSGDFELASFQVKAVGKDNIESETEINFLSSDMQIVDKKVKELKIDSEELKIKLESNDL